MRAYYYDNLEGDQRLPHDSGNEVDQAGLEKLGVLYYRLPALAGVDELAARRGYRNRDEIVVSPEKMGDKYEGMVRKFFDEHLHEDEEIRYVRGGQGYFDVRSGDDAWIRIALEKDDLIILPAGIYHRFTTDEKNVSDPAPFPGMSTRSGHQRTRQYIQAMRLFQDEPKWTPLPRSGELDANEQRRAYVAQYAH
ncbi:Acireductone dioxygenase ARD family [Xylariaceae sp. FL0804]|nr:Acireductone dioxygenase ARD family [Xylariaceae sp. FL0804]